MRTVTNYFLVNLSVADLMMSLLNCVFNFIFMINSDWPFGATYCVLNNFISNTTVAASAFTLVAISVDRYMAIVRPLQHSLSRGRAGLALLVIWCSSGSLALPCLLYSRVMTMTTQYCGNSVRRAKCTYKIAYQNNRGMDILGNRNLNEIYMQNLVGTRYINEKAMSFNAEYPKWLDEQFIEEALREGEGNNKIEVKQINVQNTAGNGEHNASIFYRVAVDYVTESDPDAEVFTKSLIVKDHPEREDGDHYVAESSAFAREADVLRKIIPSFHRLLNTSSAERSVVLAPRCFYYTSEPHQKMAMEDLCQSGFKMAQKAFGLDLDHCEIAVSHLGMFHAASVALCHQDRQSFESFLVYPSLEDSDAMREILQHSFDAVSGNVKAWPEEGQKHCDLVNRLGERAIQFLEKVVQRDEEGFNVLNHGDAWMYHMMFRYREDGELLDVAFVDFQHCYYGSPALDLHYFLYSSPSPEVRSLHFDHLLECYHTSLSQTLARLSCDERCPSLDDLHIEMEKRVWMGLFTAICVMPVVFDDPDIAIDIADTLDDYSEVDFKHISEEYTKEIIKLLPMFENKCLIVEEHSNLV